MFVVYKMKNKFSVLTKTRLVLFLYLLLIGDVLAQPNGGEPVAQQFWAGASTSNITPSLGKGIVGNFGTPPPATHVHDQLHARTLVLDDGDTKLVFVIVDNVAIKREVFDEAKRRIHEETGLPVSNILMSATHTHSCIGAGGGPTGDELGWCDWDLGKELVGYQIFLVDRMVDGVLVALNNLEPARVGWGLGVVPQHLFNRRWKMKEPVINPFGKKEIVRMNPGVANPDLLEPAGPTDPQVSFLSVQSADGRPIALLGNYSLHYVGGVPSGHLSADYFGFFADRIQDLLGADRQDPPFVGIMSNGTSGDVNNIDFRGPAEKYPPYGKMKLVADDVAGEVFRVYKTIKHLDWVKLQVEQSELVLDVRRATPEMLADIEEIMALPESQNPMYHPLEKVFAESVLQMEDEYPDEVEVIVQAFRIGELNIAAIPFEVFTETGLEIKQKIPGSQTFTISLANGWGGYLPTPEQHVLGGYETWFSVNKVEKTASRKIVDELISLFSRMN